MANIVALAVALRERTDFDVRKRACRATRRPRIYCSTETHNCLDKGADLLGLGSESVRRIPVDGTSGSPPRPSRPRSRRIVRTAGSPSASSAMPSRWAPAPSIRSTTSPMSASASGLWFHVDGAIGAVGVLSPTLAPALVGLERADSIAFDLHKWLYVPYEAGCLLVRDVETQAPRLLQRDRVSLGARRGTLVW